MRMICLANSFKDGGRCIAGIDTATGMWVRPVIEHGGSVPQSKTYVKAGRFPFIKRQLAPLEIVEIDVKPCPTIQQFQCENQIIAGWRWRIVGREKPGNLLKYCDGTAPIFYSSSDRIYASVLRRMPPECWRSLQLVQPLEVAFERDQRGKWRVRFKDAKGGFYDLSLTDPFFMNKLRSGVPVSKNCLLTISLTRPFVPNNDPSRPAVCYKVAAGVIEL